MARRTALKEMPKGGGYQPAKPKLAPGLIGPGPLQRLSPGVYRNTAGQLVGPQGQRLPGTPRPNPLERAFVGASAPERLRQGNPVFAGGTPNFDERTGRYTDPRQGALRGNLDVERAAQERAEAIRRGGMVTYDYMPERDRRVDEILGRQPGNQNPPMGIPMIPNQPPQGQRTPQIGPPLTWNDQQPVMGPMELPQGQNPYAYQQQQFSPVMPKGPAMTSGNTSIMAQQPYRSLSEQEAMFQRAVQNGLRGYGNS